MAGVALRQAEELCVSCGKHLPLSGECFSFECVNGLCDAGTLHSLHKQCAVRSIESSTLRPSDRRSTIASSDVPSLLPQLSCFACGKGRIVCEQVDLKKRRKMKAPHAPHLEGRRDTGSWDQKQKMVQHLHAANNTVNKANSSSLVPPSVPQPQYVPKENASQWVSEGRSPTYSTESNVHVYTSPATHDGANPHQHAEYLQKHDNHNSSLKRETDPSAHDSLWVYDSALEAPSAPIRKKQANGLSRMQMCQSYVRTGSCHYGDECPHAHNTGELDVEEAIKAGFLPQGFKTKLCQSIVGGGPCKRSHSNDVCHFAHSAAERRVEEAISMGIVPPTYKTKLCTRALREQGCMFGERCADAHSLKELRIDAGIAHGRLPKAYKTVECERFSKEGRCPYGDLCKMAHGKEQLRVASFERVPRGQSVGKQRDTSNNTDETPSLNSSDANGTFANRSAKQREYRPQQGSFLDPAAAWFSAPSQISSGDMSRSNQSFQDPKVNQFLSDGQRRLHKHHKLQECQQSWKEQQTATESVNFVDAFPLDVSHEYGESVVQSILEEDTGSKANSCSLFGGLEPGREDPQHTRSIFQNKTEQNHENDETQQQQSRFLLPSRKQAVPPSGDAMQVHREGGFQDPQPLLMNAFGQQETMYGMTTETNASVTPPATNTRSTALLQSRTPGSGSVDSYSLFSGEATGSRHDVVDMQATQHAWMSRCAPHSAGTDQPRGAVTADVEEVDRLFAILCP